VSPRFRYVFPSVNVTDFNSSCLVSPTLLNLVPGAANGTEGHSLYTRPWYVAHNTGLGPAFYSFDMRVEKSIYLKPEDRLWIELTVDGTNLLNHTNLLAVNNVFPIGDPFLTAIL
jgi:hypothetical protein